MGVAHGKKTEHHHQHPSDQDQNQDKDQDQTHDQNQDKDQDRGDELPTSPVQPDSQEESRDLITPQKLLNPVSESRSHQDLHKELRMSYKRAVCADGRPELRRVLEKRNWEQGMKQRREEEEEKNRSPLHQELLKRHQRLETLEREPDQQHDDRKSSPEFVRVKERLRRTRTTLQTARGMEV